MRIRSSVNERSAECDRNFEKCRERANSFKRCITIRGTQNLPRDVAVDSGPAPARGLRLSSPTPTRRSAPPRPRERTLPLRHRPRAVPHREPARQVTAARPTGTESSRLALSFALSLVRPSGYMITITGFWPGRQLGCPATASQDGLAPVSSRVASGSAPNGPPVRSGL
jgi:hypothetical protein